MDAGLSDVTCEAHVIIVTDAATILEGLAGRVSIERARDAGAITMIEAEQLIAAAWELDRTGRYTAGIPLYTVSGRVPETHV